jgi:hypothetical protein
MFCAFALFYGTAHAAPLSEIQKFYRCYKKFVEVFPATNHPLLLSVQGGGRAIDACMTLLNQVMLDPVSGRLVNNTAENRAILRTFYNFFRTAYFRDSYIELYGNGQLEEDLLHDDEAALYFVRALFTGSGGVHNMPLSSVFSTNGMNATRSLGATAPGGVSPITSSALSSFGFLTPFPGSATFINTFVQLGDLIGADAVSAGHPRYDTRVATVDPNGANFPPIYINRNLGGGAVGSQSYVLLNFGHGIWQLPNGGGAMPRRLSKSIAHDFLCRDLPVHRAGDVGARPNSNLAFANGACQMCHGYMDNVNKLWGNLELVPTSNPAAGGRYGLAMYPWPTDQSLPGMRDWTVDDDPNYFRRSPTGRFIYRRYTGEFMNIPVDSLSQLGQLLAGMHRSLTTSMFVRLRACSTSLRIFPWTFAMWMTHLIT